MPKKGRNDDGVINREELRGKKDIDKKRGEKL